MLTVRQMKKTFDGTEILKGVDLQVDKGDVVAILGPSGAGKTTLLRCMNFLEAADSGELEFDGQRFELNTALLLRFAKRRLHIDMEQRKKGKERIPWDAKTWKKPGFHGILSLFQQESPCYVNA